MIDVDIGRLTLEIAANAKGASSQITNIKKSLQSLQETVSGLSGLAQVSQQMQSMAKGFSAISSATANMTGFRTAKTALKGTIEALQQLKSVDVTATKQQLKTIGDAFKGLSSIEKGGFSSTVNALKKLPDAAKSLADVDMAKFASDCDAAATAIRPLANEMEKVSAGFAAFPQKMGAMNQAAARTTNVFGKLENVFNRVFSVMMLRKVGSIIGNWINLSTQYTEDLNLFTVAMGKYADSAQEYAEKVSEVMGIDVADWLRHQGVFMTLATGFGVASDRAAIMSKNLTQLAYDLSSFYNLDVDEAMQKLESGFAGEIEPVRRLGYDLSKTTLQATAASLGITKLFADMTQAEKSQLRYYALMTQVTQVQGDMARTLEAPANQLRIFQAQLEMTKRALGNIFIPALNAVLPYVIAFAKFIRLLADEIARLFGFSLPEIDYSSVNTGIASVADETDDLSDSLGRTYNRAKQVKNLLASFDELNIIQSETGGGSGAGSGGIGSIGSSGWNDFALPEYDFLSNVISSKVDTIFAKMRKTLEKMKPILKYLKDNFNSIKGIVFAILEGILGWKVAKGLGFGSKTTAGIGLSILGFSTEFSGAKAIGRGDAGLIDYLKTAIGAALGIAGSLIIFGTGPAGWVIGIGAALTIFLTGIRIGRDQHVSDMVNEAFYGEDGDITITAIADQFAEFAESVTSVNQPIIDAGKHIDELKKSAQGAYTDLDKLLSVFGDETYGSNIEEVGRQFQELNGHISLINEEVYRNLKHAISGSIAEALAENGTNIPALMGVLDQIAGRQQEQMDDLGLRYQEIYDNIAAGTVTTEEAKTQLQGLADEYYALLYDVDKVETQFVGLSEIVKGVNWENAEAAQQAFEQIESTAQAAQDSAREAYQSIHESIEHMRGFAKTPEEIAYLDELEAAAQRTYENQLNAIKEHLLGIAEVVEGDLQDRTFDILESARQEWNQMSALERWWYYDNDPAQLYAKALAEYDSSVVHPVENALNDALSKFGAGVDWKAHNPIAHGANALALYTTGDSLVHHLTQEALAGFLGTREYGSYYDVVREYLETQFAAANRAAQDAAEESMSGMSTSDWFNYEAWDDFMKLVRGEITEADFYNKYGYPAGYDFVTGFWDGVKNAAESATENAVQEITGATDEVAEKSKAEFHKAFMWVLPDAYEMGTDLGRQIGNGMAQELLTVGQRIQQWWARFSLPVPRVAPNAGSANPSDWVNVPVPAFASGGFPTSGALFIAGENPELVGTMGGRTAVANGDQIVTGIAYGVSQANGEQNRLLREQNTLLRQLVAQGGKVVFSPSPEAGRAVEMSLNMYATQRGY